MSIAVTLSHYLAVGALLFVIGLVGIVVNRRNVILILMSIELILLAVNVNLVAFSSVHGGVHGGDPAGQIFVLMVLTVAAAEAAIGLAIFVAYYRHHAQIAIDKANALRG